jgi:hypothetical protein
MEKFSYDAGRRDRGRVISLRVRATSKHKQKQKSSVIYFRSKKVLKKKRENAFFWSRTFSKKSGKMHF